MNRITTSVLQSLLLIACLLTGVSGRTDDSIWTLPEKPENAELTGLLVTPQENIILRYRFRKGSFIESRTRIQLADRNGQVIQTWDLDGFAHVRTDAAGHIMINISTNESVDRILVADSSGHALFERVTRPLYQSAWPSIYGSEILLATQPMAETLLFGGMTFLDADTGEVNGTFRKATIGHSGIGFILLGKDHRFILGDGATLLMTAYTAPDSPVWKIDNIGGTIDELRFLNQSVCVVSYRGDGYRGKALIHMETGNVLYRTVPHHQHWGESGKKETPGADRWFVALKNGDMLMIKDVQSRGDALLLRNQGEDLSHPRYDPAHVEPVQLPLMSGAVPGSNELLHQIVFKGKSLLLMSGNRVRIQDLVFPRKETD